MFRRLVVILVVSVLILPLYHIHAQDGNSPWVLTQTFSTSDLGFQFNFPEDWVYAYDVDGVKFAESQDELDAITDSDPTTVAEGHRILFSAVYTENLGLDMKTTVDKALLVFLTSAGLEAQSDPVDASILTHRSLSLYVTVSTDSDKQGVLTIWQQHNKLVYMALFAPEITDDDITGWSDILSSIRPLDALSLSDTPMTLPTSKLTMQYPEGWYAPNDSTSVYEVEADASHPKSPEGYLVSVTELRLESLGSFVKDISDFSATVQEGLVGTNDLLSINDHLILEQPAQTFRAKVKNSDYYALITIFIANDTALVAGIVAPSEEKLNVIAPTWFTMLESIAKDS